jgi:CPA2 family monovalent cation:H+ antiporter-2
VRDKRGAALRLLGRSLKLEKGAALARVAASDAGSGGRGAGALLATAQAERERGLQIADELQREAVLDYSELLRALEDQGGLDTEVGRIAVGWLIVEDLLMVLALVVLPTLAPASAAHGAQAGPTDLWLALGITFAKVAAFVVFMLVVGLRFFPWLLKQAARTGSRELFTLAVVAVALGVALGSAALFGVSFALGAFFAGIVIHESDLSERAATESQPLQDLFGALFFVSVGMLLDPMVLVNKPVHVLMVTLIILAGKSLACFVIVRALGYPLRAALTVSAALAQIGEFSFILAGLGISLRLLPQEANDLILAGALLSITLNPLVFKLLTRGGSGVHTPRAERV